MLLTPLGVLPFSLAKYQIAFKCVLLFYFVYQGSPQGHCLRSRSRSQPIKHFAAKLRHFCLRALGVLRSDFGDQRPPTNSRSRRTIKIHQNPCAELDGRAGLDGHDGKSHEVLTHCLDRFELIEESTFRLTPCDRQHYGKPTYTMSPPINMITTFRGSFASVSVASLHPMPHLISPRAMLNKCRYTQLVS